MNRSFGSWVWFLTKSDLGGGEPGIRTCEFRKNRNAAARVVQGNQQGVTPYVLSVVFQQSVKCFDCIDWILFLSACICVILQGNSIIQHLQSEIQQLKSKVKLKSTVIQQQEALIQQRQHVRMTTATATPLWPFFPLPLHRKCDVFTIEISSCFSSCSFSTICTSSWTLPHVSCLHVRTRYHPWNRCWGTRGVISTRACRS